MLLAPIPACLIFPLDNTTSSCEDKSNTFFLYFSELRRRNSLRHNLVSNLYHLFIKRPFGLFDISVSGLHPTLCMHVSYNTLLGKIVETNGNFIIYYYGCMYVYYLYTYVCMYVFMYVCIEN